MRSRFRRLWDMERLVLSLWFALTAVILAGCSDDRHLAPLPNGFPPLPVPAGATLTDERVNVGQRLSYDKQVSRMQGITCSGCQGAAVRTPGPTLGPTRVQRIGASRHAGRLALEAVQRRRDIALPHVARPPAGGRAVHQSPPA